MPRRLPPPLACALVALSPVAARAACPSDEAVAQLARDMLANRPSAALTDMISLEDGFCAQDKLVRLLEPHWGRPVGHKLALTAEAGRRRFGVPHPLRAVLLEQAVSLRDGAEVPARFGAVPIIESDLLLRVRDEGVNDAGRDHLAILRHLDAVMPFIELGDLVLSGGFDAPNLLAINMPGRLGVVGEPIPVEPTEDFARRLAAMTVTMTDDTGRELARQPGTAVLGHPLNAVAFLVEDLARAGRRLRAGDLLSVAGYSPTLPVEAGRTYTVRYEGLRAEPVSLSVRMAR